MHISWIRCNENMLYIKLLLLNLHQTACLLSPSSAISAFCESDPPISAPCLSALMALCLSGPSCSSLYELSSDQSALKVPLRRHLDCTNTTVFWSVSVRSVSPRWAPLQSADPGRHWAVGGPWGWRRDREQTSVTTLLPHCPAAR